MRGILEMQILHFFQRVQGRGLRSASSKLQKAVFVAFWFYNYAEFGRSNHKNIRYGFCDFTRRINGFNYRGKL